MQDKLKPLDCIRCGGSLELHTIQTGMSTMGSYVKCSECELQGKTFNDYHGNHMKLATEFWNARATDKTIEALVDALKDVKNELHRPVIDWQFIKDKVKAALLAAGEE